MDYDKPQADEEVCGEAYDHDAEIDYDGPDGVQWSCRRCGAEGWDPRDSDVTPVGEGQPPVSGRP
ncbi:hypothetical protein ACFV0Y_16880 [Streptomyces sp. NPDC059569]|uniref:hypothetical protein n=1 Tax=Streptomyces sp. NPDC059569 TaxID=3346869 RepID=UPI0036C74EE9